MQKYPLRTDKKRSQKGIALFLVLSAIGVLSFLVVEFTYMVQLNQRIAYEFFDRLQSYYTAKSAWKLSLLRIHIYQQIQKKISDLKAKNISLPIPKKLLDQVWKFPLIYPIPTQFGNWSETQKTAILKFQKSSKIEGRYVSKIESESGKFPLNNLVELFTPKTPKSSTNAQNSTKSSNSNTDQSSNTDPKDQNVFDPAQARKALTQLFQKLFSERVKSSETFATQYRDFELLELLENIFRWVDRTYQSDTWPRDFPIKPKKAPFYSLTELHMIPKMDDTLYQLFAPSLTTIPNLGINLNTLNPATLAALLPEMTEKEQKAFFKYRDDPLEDHSFADEESFYTYLKNNVTAFANSDQAISDLKKRFQKQGTVWTTSEEAFHISVSAQVRRTQTHWEGWVRLSKETNTVASSTPEAPNTTPPLSGPGLLTDLNPHAGIEVLRMRIH